MTTTITTRMTRPRAQSVAILRWVFARGRRLISCEIRWNGPRSHDVCVVPHWSVDQAVVEHFDRPSDALRRHAEIASSFREAGWILMRERPDGNALAA
ncbi:MAG TPA: hypothetical protein VIW45_05495 [Vicinamibacterales bacterium]|jgi:hypothetical protein